MAMSSSVLSDQMEGLNINKNMKEVLKVGAAQITPIFLNKAATIKKVCEWVDMAGKEGCDLVAFGEALVPGYPHWLDCTDGAKIYSNNQKKIFAHYLKNSVDISGGDLCGVCALAKTHNMSVSIGVVEKGVDRGSHTLYCSSVYINQEGEIANVHRKLMPTYDERLVWGSGDGHGLRTNQIGEFTFTSLNCWENWMPLARAALYAQGTNLHVAHWPGTVGLTKDITRFVAMESRSFVISASNFLRKEDIPEDFPLSKEFKKNCNDSLANGGSCIAGPDGKWLVEPQTDKEGLFTAEVDVNVARGARLNFDPSGHYSRPDVTKLTVNRERLTVARFNDS